MSSRYWRKVAIECLYLRCCVLYAVDGFVQLGAFAVAFRRLVEDAAGKSARAALPRAALELACAAFLDDAHVANGVADLLLHRFPLAGVNLAFVDCTLMLHALDSALRDGAGLSIGAPPTRLLPWDIGELDPLSGLPPAPSPAILQLVDPRAALSVGASRTAEFRSTPVQMRIGRCHKADAYRLLAGWLCGEAEGGRVLPTGQVALTPGALVAATQSVASNSAVAPQVKAWDGWLARQLQSATNRDRGYASDVEPQQLPSKTPQFPAYFHLSSASELLGPLASRHPYTSVISDPAAVARTMHAGSIEQRRAANPSLEASGASEWLDRQIELAGRHAHKQQIEFELDDAKRLPLAYLAPLVPRARS
ncbi:hypothetical protein T492DRAFT_1150161 [Pavlovales sp. CCMP2436]|nr:hypothetical protein T492DRAFT_1150161 [Pavlovales sp. CCMP2436]